MGWIKQTLEKKTDFWNVKKQAIDKKNKLNKLKKSLGLFFRFLVCEKQYLNYKSQTTFPKNQKTSEAAAGGHEAFAHVYLLHLYRCNPLTIINDYFCELWCSHVILFTPLNLNKIFSSGPHMFFVFFLGLLPHRLLHALI
jgi:hypothetical protein